MLTKHVFLGLGSNLGDRHAYLQAAVEVLASFDEIQLNTQSSVIETTPMGDVEQGDYLNAVVEIETTCSPRQLLAVCHQIENAQGRVRNVRWGPRTLDIDILLFGDQIIDEEGLCIPHPGILVRKFVFEPLLEIAPTLVHPCLKTPIMAMLHPS